MAKTLSLHRKCIFTNADSFSWRLLEREAEIEPRANEKRHALFLFLLHIRQTYGDPLNLAVLTYMVVTEIAGNGCTLCHSLSGRASDQCKR